MIDDMLSSSNHYDAIYNNAGHYSNVHCGHMPMLCYTIHTHATRSFNYVLAGQMPIMIKKHTYARNMCNMHAMHAMHVR